MLLIHFYFFPKSFKIVMVYMAAVTGKVLTDEQKMGSAIAISGVLLYSLIDDLMKGSKKGKKD